MSESDIQHLEWIYYRLVMKHDEREYYDYMIKFREILEKIRQQQQT